MDRVVAGSKEDKRFDPIPHYAQPKEASTKTVVRQVTKEIVVPDPEVEKENQALKEENASLKREVAKLAKPTPKPVAKPTPQPKPTTVKKVVKKVVRRKVANK